MQIKGLHKNIYRLSQYALSQEKAADYRKKHALFVKRWETAKAQGCDDGFCQEHSGISKATYYRYKQKLRQLSVGILPPSKRPKRLRNPKRGLSLNLCQRSGQREKETLQKAMRNLGTIKITRRWLWVNVCKLTT